MEDRMTWDEICQLYPGQHIGLSDVEWENDSTVRSAVVKYSMENATRAEIQRAVADSDGDLFMQYTGDSSLLNTAAEYGGKLEMSDELDWGESIGNEVW